MTPRSRLVRATIAIASVLLLIAVSALLYEYGYVPRCSEVSFGDNLGFENGNLDGWTGPIGFWNVTTDVAHSGKYSVVNEVSSKFASELYQNWGVRSLCQIYLEAYVLVDCGPQGFNVVGIELRETDDIVLAVSVCPNPGFSPLDEDAVVAGIRTSNLGSNTTWIRFPFEHGQWYKLGLTAQPKEIAFYVNDRLVHVDQRTAEFVNPSFGATVSAWSGAYFDDFKMGQRNPPGLEIDSTLSTSLQAALSPGVAAIGDWHGGAIEQAAKMLQNAVRRMR